MFRDSSKSPIEKVVNGVRRVHLNKLGTGKVVARKSFIQLSNMSKFNSTKSKQQMQGTKSVLFQYM